MLFYHKCLELIYVLNLLLIRCGWVVRDFKVERTFDFNHKVKVMQVSLSKVEYGKFRSKNQTLHLKMSMKILKIQQPATSDKKPFTTYLI